MLALLMLTLLMLSLRDSRSFSIGTYWEEFEQFEPDNLESVAFAIY